MLSHHASVSRNSTVTITEYVSICKGIRSVLVLLSTIWKKDEKTNKIHYLPMDRFSNTLLPTPMAARDNVIFDVERMVRNTAVPRP